MKTRGLTTICMILFLLLGVQCDRNNKSRLDESTVILGYPGDETIFFQDPWWMGAEYLMFLSFGEENENGELQPSLAERWKHSPDYREWTIFLHSDVKWHDGVPVTTEDIKFTMDLRIISAGGEVNPEKVKIIDAFTLKISYENPRMPSFSDVYYPKHLLKNLNPKEVREWEFWKQPVGNGPYRYVRHVPNTMVELEANPDHYREKPKIEKVILKFLQEMNIAELLSGNVDSLWGVNRDLLYVLSGDKRFHAYHSFADHFEVLYWNHRRPLFKNPKIRKALTLAIDRTELSIALNYPTGVPKLDTITTSRQFRLGLYPEALPYDPDQARAILDETGWQDKNGDGIRERSGEDFEFTLLANSSFYDSAIFVQDQFKKIGVRMEIQTVDNRLMQQKYYDMSEIDAKLFFMPNSIRQPRYGHVKLFGEQSALGYSNPKIIRLLNQAFLIFDEDELDRIYGQIMPIFVEDMPVTILLPRVFTNIVNRRIKGLSSPLRADPVYNLEHLWIEE